MKKILIFFLLWMVPVVAGAGSRDLLFHQGLVLDTDENPVEGSIDVTFRLYNSTSSSEPLWEEAQSLSFEGGVYTAELGDLVPFPDGIFTEETLFLGVQIGDDSEMTPRLGIFSVPFAQQAEVAVVAQSLADDVVTSGNIAPGGVGSSDIEAGAVGANEIASTGVTPGTYTLATVTIDADGRITSAASGVTTGASINSSEIEDGTVTGADISAVAGITDGQVSDTLTAGLFKGAGSATDAVDLATTEVAGILGVGRGGTGSDLSTTGGGTNQFVKQTGLGGTLTVGAITDTDVPNSITINLAATATALAANGANCAAGSYPLGVDAGGAAEGCTADDDSPDSDAEVPDALTVSAFGNVAAAAVTGTLVDSQVANNITIDLASTATALAANGANCGAGNYPLGVDASGNAEDCTAAAAGTVTSVGSGNGLTGGPIVGAGTLAVGAGTGIVVNADDIAVDVGTAAGKIVQLDGTARLPAVDGSLLTAIRAGNVVNVTDTTSQSLTDADVAITDSNPTITLSGNTSRVLVMVSVNIDADNGDNETNVFKVWRNSSCSGTQVGGGLKTFTTDEDEFANISAMFVDSPATAGDVTYSFCHDDDATGTVSNDTITVTITLMEIGA